MIYVLAAGDKHMVPRGWRHVFDSCPESPGTSASRHGLVASQRVVRAMCQELVAMSLLVWRLELETMYLVCSIMCLATSCRGHVCAIWTRHVAVGGHIPDAHARPQVRKSSYRMLLMIR